MRLNNPQIRDFGQVSAGIRELLEEVRPAIVGIRNGNGDGGSGVRWAQDLIISNHHVVHGETCRITFSNGDEANARVISREEENDLVALRIDGHAPLLERPLEIDLTKPARIGELVLAVGHPMGVEWAITMGIISRLPAEAGPRRLLRASLTLLPGNSGGALVNASGELVGINTMLTGPAEAVAIPADVVDAFARLSATSHSDGKPVDARPPVEV